MLTTPMDIVTQFPVRKTKAQKQAFRDAVQSYATELGYETRVESGSFGVRNLILGDPDTAHYLITAHYDTCARLPFPNLITPCNLWLFLGYQLFMVLAMLVPAAVLGVLTWAVSGSELAGQLVWVIALWADIFLMLIGPANPSNVNDNTSGVVTAMEIAKTLPENARDKVCFVLFDLEEAGLLGSAAYRKAHPESTRQLVINMDCVGEGNELLFFPTKKLLKDKKKLAPLYAVCGYFGKKSLLVRDKGFSVYPSDQMNFPYGVGIAALNRKKKTLYLGRIHTPKDTILDETNVNILRAALTTLICR